MKRLLPIVLFLLVSGRARGDEADEERPIAPTAEAWIAHLQACQKRIFSVEARFTQALVHRLKPETEELSGTVRIRRTGGVRIDYTAPVRRLVVSDGTSLWVYDKETNQALKSRADESLLPALFELFLGPGDRKRFEATYLSGGTAGGAQVAVISLTPATRDPFVASIVLTLEDRCPSVRRVLVEDHSGSVTRVTLTALKTNVGIGNNLFRFTPPAGATIVQP